MYVIPVLHTTVYRVPEKVLIKSSHEYLSEKENKREKFMAGRYYLLKRY